MKILTIILIMQVQLIPMKFSPRENLYRFIKPSDSISWWEIGQCDIGTNWHKIIYCSDTSIKVDLPPLKSYNTYFSCYFNASLRRDFLVYKMKSGETRYINEVENIPAFIGSVDNLAEALFISSIYGYYFIPGKKYGSYCYKNGVYTLNLYKIINSQESTPVIIIDKNGNEVEQKYIKAKIKILKNGDAYEITGGEGQNPRKLQALDMHRIL